MSILKTT